MKCRLLALLVAACLCIGLAPNFIPQALAADFDTSGWVWPVKAVDAPTNASNQDLYCKTMYRAYYTDHQAIDITDYTGYTYAVRAAKSGTVAIVYSGCVNYSGAGSGGVSCAVKGCYPTKNGSYHSNTITYDGKTFCNYGFGNGVVIDHNGGVDRSEYAHMSSVVVSPGQYVQAGEIIGYMGSAGASTGKHLDFVIKHNYGNGLVRVNNNPVGDVVLKNVNLWNGVDVIAYADEPSVEVAPVDPFLWEHYAARQDTSQQTNAVLAQKLTMNNGQSASTVTEVGIFLYSSQSEDSLLASKLENPIPTDDSTIHMWYDVNNELGLILTPGTTYYYRFYADGNYTEWYSFTTAGQPEPEYLTVTLDLSGGSCGVTEITVIYGQTYGELPIPTKEHNNFLYWCDNKGHIISANTVVELTGSQTIYATWSAKYYNLSFQTNGGIALEEQSIRYRTQVELSEYVTIREGFTFTGWYTDSALTELAEQITMTEDLTLYAGWNAEQADEPTDPEETKPTEPSEPTEPVPTVEFTDVDKDAWYAAPVNWAVSKGVTNGVGDGKFGPDQQCTRAQVVTFLWRAAGSPEPSSGTNPFTDVKADAYYYKAVLWAVEKGITTGTSATTFSPDASCTRAQVATFLWRAQGQPKAEKAGQTFTDVPAGQYYYNAVLWAVENGVTNGMGDGKFAPDATCTRGQIVTFLYRALA